MLRQCLNFFYRCICQLLQWCLLVCEITTWSLVVIWLCVQKLHISCGSLAVDALSVTLKERLLSCLCTDIVRTESLKWVCEGIVDIRAFQGVSLGIGSDFHKQVGGHIAHIDFIQNYEILYTLLFVINLSVNCFLLLILSGKNESCDCDS